jgi:hypothetical protein
MTDALQRLDHICATEAEPRLDSRREPAERIYDRQDADLRT